MWFLFVAAAASQPASQPFLTLELGEPLEGQTFEDAMNHGIAQSKAHTARGVLADVKHDLEERVIPHASHSELVAFAKQLLNDVESIPKPSQGQTNPREYTLPGQGGDSALKAKLCMGSCGQTHEVFRLVIVVRLEHDERGRITSHRVVIPSVSHTFNAHVVEHLPQIVPLVTKPGEPIPVWSEWAIHAVQYRWGIIERILDPQFKPKSLVTEAHLITVKYR